MAQHIDVIIRRTKKERQAYIDGFASAIEMVKRHGLAQTQLMHSFVLDLVETSGGDGSGRGETGSEIAQPSAFLSPDSEKRDADNV